MSIVLDSLADGMTLQDILDHLPQLTKEDIQAAIAYGVRVPTYARSIRCNDGDPQLDDGAPGRGERALRPKPQKAHWSVVGDCDSLQTAECQSLHRDLGHYGTRRRCDEDDIVVAAAAADNDDTGGPVRVFGDKTQGYPYHFAVLAAAMVVEERFPRHAMVWGDIDRGQAEVARQMAATILGRDLPLPVRTDAARLMDRLRARYDEAALPAAFERVFLGETDCHEAVLRAFPGEQGARQWQRALAQYKSPGSLGAIGLVIAWLNAGRDLRDACRFACLAPEGPRFSPRAFIDALASTWVAIPRPAREPLDVFRKPSGASHLTEHAWDAILAERDTDVLAWCIALACMRADELHLSQVRRAFFENAELRRHAVAIGRNEREMREIGEFVAKARSGKA